MRGRGERSVRDLYDRTRHKDLGLAEELAEGCDGRGGGRAEASGHREVVVGMEDKATVRKRLVSGDSPRLKSESGTCNVCSAPCSSCLHRSFAIVDSNVDCGSSQTCCTRTETKNCSSVGSDKVLRSKGGENDDEFSATSSHASYCETAGNKVMARSSIAGDSSEVDMPAKRRRLLNQDTRSPRAEFHDDSNSCVTGISAAGKHQVDKQKEKFSTSASSRDLAAKDCKDNSIARSQNLEYQMSHSRLRNTSVEESTRKKKRSDVHEMHPSSSDRLACADSPSSMTKNLPRTQSSVSVMQGLSPQRPSYGFGDSQDNLPHEHCEKASLSNNNVEYSSGGKLNPCVDGDDKHGTLTNCGMSNRNKIKDGTSPQDLENGTSCSRNEVQEHVDIQSNNGAKRNDSDKQEQNQDCSMDTTGDKKSKIQNEMVTECGNSEGLIDVNVCDICGDVGREYLLATCTRCLEGAEHTYCMRVKLDKVPDGDWLCEECQVKEAQNKTKINYGASTANFLDGKKQSSESVANPKLLQVVTNFEAQQITCGTPTAEQSDGKNQNSHAVSTDQGVWQVICATSTAERLDAKTKNSGNIVNRKKLQVVTSDLDVRAPTCPTPTAGSFNEKNQTSEVMLKRKKLRVSTDTEAPLSSEGQWSPPKSCKRHTEGSSSPNPRLFEKDSPRKLGVFSGENSIKKSDNRILKSTDNAPLRIGQAAKSSMTLSRSYSLGSMVKVKAQVPSPQGILSKQLSFNNLNNEPKVKQLAEGMASKLRPAKHSPRDPREKGVVKKVMKTGSFKNDGSLCKDPSSLKHKQFFHLSQSEKPRILKPMREKNLLERKASFNLQKPNIPLSPKPDSSMKSGDLKIDQDSARSGSSVLKSGKMSGSVEKKQSSYLSKSAKQGITKVQKTLCVVSAKDGCAVKISDSTLPRQSGKQDSMKNGADEAVPSPTLVKNDDEIPTKIEVLSAPHSCMTTQTSLQDMVPRASASDNLTPAEASDQQKTSESIANSSCRSPEVVLEAVHASQDILPESPHGPPTEYNQCSAAIKLNELDLKPQDFGDQSSILRNPFRISVIPEQNYIWQGSFEVSRPGNSPEMFDGIQAHLSTCVSPKVLEVVKQLPHSIQLEEVPRLGSWPLQFKEVNPSEANIALFFFAKDIESYERTYRKLLENMLVDDSSLAAYIGGVELLIFPSDKLPEKSQRWNGLLFLWGVLYARKNNSSVELPVREMNHRPSEQSTESVVHEACSPKVLQPLSIDLNECPCDELFGIGVSLGLEAEKSSASGDDKALLESKCDNGNLHAHETHPQGRSSTRQIAPGSAAATLSKAHPPANSMGDSGNMILGCPSAAIGTAIKDDMGEEEIFIQSRAPFCFEGHADLTAVDSPSSNEISIKKQATLSSEAPAQHSRGSKFSDDASELISTDNLVLLDVNLDYKRRKTSHGVHSSRSLGHAENPGKQSSKIHPLPTGQHELLDDVQYVYGGPADPFSPTKPNSDRVIHVLSSDDEDSPEQSTSHKTSLKVEEGPSPLLSLSLSMAASKHNLASSETGDDASLSLSLGLPGVVKGNQALEMKQFLPEKPGINTSLLL